MAPAGEGFSPRANNPYAGPADPDATRLSAPADPDATRLSAPGATRVANPGATRLAGPVPDATRVQSPARPAAPAADRTVAAPVPARPVPAAGRPRAATPRPDVPSAPAADVARAAAARELLDRQGTPADADGWQPAGQPRHRARSARKGPLSRRRLRFWRWFRAVPITLMVVMGVLSVALSMLPGTTVRDWLYPVHYVDAVTASAERHGVDPSLVAAVIKSESNWVSTARSDAGAQGLMQLMPSTARELAGRGYVDAGAFDPDDLSDPATNIEYGTAYLAYLIDTTGSADRAVAAYNAGPGAASAWEGTGDTLLDSIEYPETRLYLERVTEAYDQYRTLYPDGLVDDGA